MPVRKVPSSTADARRLARRAWTLLHQDAKQSIALAESALAAAGADDVARAAALLVRGFHRLYFATPAEAAADLEAARQLFAKRGDRGGSIVAGAGLARSMWRNGRFREALETVLPLRDEGLKVLRGDQRGVLLNTIAGGYSAQGRSDRAFAYMYEALRDARPARGHGFDTVLHCNISHELLQLGDCHEALRHIDSGLARCERIANQRLLSVLLINRIIGLTDLERPAEALPDVQRVLAMPASADGRGPM
ncbi:MAG: GGDEF domain-containing protein, partial [Rubrivivax sp.]